MAATTAASLLGLVSHLQVGTASLSQRACGCECELVCDTQCAIAHCACLFQRLLYIIRQSMETAFTGVLLESALKLSNVTDANIFILVETSEGRQWAGNRRLKVRLKLPCRLLFDSCGDI